MNRQIDKYELDGKLSYVTSESIIPLKVCEVYKNDSILFITLTLSGMAHLLQAGPQLVDVRRPHHLHLGVRVRQHRRLPLEQNHVGRYLQVPGAGHDKPLGRRGTAAATAAGSTAALL